MIERRHWFAIAIGIVAAIKPIALVLMQASKMDAALWLIFCSWFVWLCLAYLYDKDLPVMGPSSKYVAGIKNCGRIAQVALWTVLYIILSIFS